MEAGDLLGHVHLQDNDGLLDRHWTPGEGNINWHSVFRAMKQIGSDPRLILELNDHRLKPEGLKVQGSGLKVRPQTPCTPYGSCQFCSPFQV